jgi:hypothetical protein
MTRMSYADTFVNCAAEMARALAAETDTINDFSAAKGNKMIRSCGRGYEEVESAG